MFQEYTRIFRFVKPHIGMLVLAGLSMFICSLMGGISIGMLIPFVDKIISGKHIAFSSNINLPPFLETLVATLNAKDSLSLLNLLIGIVIILYLIKQVFEYAKAYFMNEVGYRFLKDIRNAIYEKILTLSMDFFYKNPTGKLTSRILFDTSVIKDSLIEGLTDLLYQPIEILVYLSIIIFVKMYFGIPVGLVIVSLGLTLLIVYPVIRMGRRIRKITLKTQEKVADINTTIFETVTGISIVNAFSMQDYELNRMKDKNNQYHKIVMKSVKRMIAIGPIVEFIALICVAIVLWIGGRGVVSRSLSAGAFIAFIAALTSLLKPFKRLSKVHTINQQALAAASRVFEVLDAKSKVFEKTGAVNLKEFKNEIIYENVHFKYEAQDILKGVSIRVKKGEIVAFVGPSGVGKTTLVNLLPRFYDAQIGAIKIDGIDIRDLTLKSLRDKIGLVTQDAIVFNDTVAQNIAYGREVKSNLEAIIKAAKASNCHSFIMNMPKGYETIIGERGVRLSGGEKQRLCIARAILKNPPILILDEATSQLDTESEVLVQQAIDNLMSGRTVLVIAHRLSTIKHANKIYVLDEGRIIECGSHEDLIIRSGVYNKLYNLQFKL
ncbi:MAG: ABC transporter ATP-binding protein/permease [Candidatus Omnitrophica bacterium]|nr:ABC transporter ATP-binding protein/permease [Candidatus Omnitrophota bacterium]